MFTGIVETTGTVTSLMERDEAWRFTISAPESVVSGLAIGDSLANNGCCLTVVETDGHSMLGFDVLDETLRLTNLGRLEPGDRVNLERPLAADGRLGGHFVSGHVDCLGEIVRFESIGKNVYLRVRAPLEYTRWIAYKGSVALDGISLTIAEEVPDGLAVWLIPHTVEVTNLAGRKEGDFLNLEFDLLAKYAEKILATKDLSSSGGSAA